MQVQSIDRMFNFTFEKTAKEVKDAALKKMTDIRAKIEERVGRIKAMRAEHKITDAVLIDIQQQMRTHAQQGMAAVYNSTVKSNDNSMDETVSVGAGVINFIITEQDFISGEREQVERLDLMTRNLTDVFTTTSTGVQVLVKFKLSYEELKFLGF